MANFELGRFFFSFSLGIDWFNGDLFCFFWKKKDFKNFPQFSCDVINITCSVMVAWNFILTLRARGVVEYILCLVIPRREYLSLRLLILFFPIFGFDCVPPARTAWLYNTIAYTIYIALWILYRLCLSLPDTHTFILSLYLYLFRIHTLPYSQPNIYTFSHHFLFCSFWSLLFKSRAIKIITIEYHWMPEHTFHRTNGINVSVARGHCCYCHRSKIRVLHLPFAICMAMALL